MDVNKPTKVNLGDYFYQQTETNIGEDKFYTGRKELLNKVIHQLKLRQKMVNAYPQHQKISYVDFRVIDERFKNLRNNVWMSDPFKNPFEGDLFVIKGATFNPVVLNAAADYKYNKV